MFHSKLLNRPSAGASLLAIAMMGCSPALAQEAPQENKEDAEDQGGLDEIVVTATKRAQNLQDVPVAVQALGEEQLDELNVQTFSDYLTQLPNVTAGGSGPGQSTIYIRGLASTTPNLTTAGVAGLAPNVALYLDEQPVSQPGRNLDVYAADLQRVEVLSGPQGTLFGASSQAGTVRLITNKPDLSGFGAKMTGGVSFTKGGEASYNAEAMINVPVSDSFALRAVVYLDDQGGYIDNVAGTRNVRESARFRPAGTVRSNGVPVNSLRGGLQSDAATLALLDANVTFIDADNSTLVEDNINDTQYAGFRASALWEITPDWKLTVAHARQSIESDGVFFADPSLGLDNLDIQRYEEDRLEDSFSNTSWTVEGQIGALELVYTGAYTERESEQTVDYSDYLFAGQYLPYYICDGSVSYPGAGGPTGTCQAPNLTVGSTSKTKVFTQELRFSTPQDYWLRATAGGFYSDLELLERNDFTYPGNVAAAPFGAFAPNSPFPGVFRTLDGPFPADVIFRNDIRRTDKQWGIFGEVTAEVIPDTLEFVFGARYYDVEVDFEGSANSSFCNSGAATDANAFGTNITDLYDGDGSFTFIGSCNATLRQTFTLSDTLADIQAAGLSATQSQQVFNALRAPDKAKTDGFIFKGTVNFRPADDVLLYLTYSEGFRPGLLNRPGGATNGTFTVPFVLDTDDVQNYEFGWKATVLDNQLRINGNLFHVKIDRLQTTIFDPSIANLFFSDNAANAKITGVEADISFAPDAIPGLTVSAAFSALDTEITEVLTPTNDVLLGEPLAFAPSFQGNMRARYEFPIGAELDMFIQPQLTYSGSAFTDIIEINKIQLDSWTTVDLSLGVKKDEWMFEIFGQNLTDERAQISGNYINDRERITVNRPMTIGARFSFTY